MLFLNMIHGIVSFFVTFFSPSLEEGLLQAQKQARKEYDAINRVLS